MAFGQEAERFYYCFFRVFADFYAPDDRKVASDLVFYGRKNFGGKLKMHYYRSRESFEEEIQKDWEEFNRKPDLFCF